MIVQGKTATPKEFGLLKPPYEKIRCLNCGRKTAKRVKHKRFCSTNCRVEYYFKKKLNVPMTEEKLKKIKQIIEGK